MKTIDASKPTFRADDDRVIRAFGQKAHVLVSSEQTGDAPCVLRFFIPPGNVTPPHLHRATDETFLIESGAAMQERGDERTGVHDHSRNLDAALQYLTWALEELDKFGHPKASLYARIALDELRGVHAGVPSRYAEEAKRLRDKADEAEQLVELAETASRRDALRTIVESYRRTAEQMDRLAKAQARTKSKIVLGYGSSI